MWMPSKTQSVRLMRHPVMLLKYRKNKYDNNYNNTCNSNNTNNNINKINYKNTTK